MNTSPVTEADGLGELVRVLDALQPGAVEGDEEATTYRPAPDCGPDDHSADGGEAESLPPEAADENYWHDAAGDQASMAGEFYRTAPVPVCAVDAGVVRLGETGQDAYVALRGSYVVE